MLHEVRLSLRGHGTFLVLMLFDHLTLNYELLTSGELRHLLITAATLSSILHFLDIFFSDIGMCHTDREINRDRHTDRQINRPTDRPTDLMQSVTRPSTGGRIKYLRLKQCVTFFIQFHCDSNLTNVRLLLLLKWISASHNYLPDSVQYVV